MSNATDQNNVINEDELTDSESRRIKWLSLAEFVDAWRIIPRFLLAGYGWMTYKVVDWYMNIPMHNEQCETVEKVTKCIIESGATTQQAALVTTVIGAAAAVFGLYTSSGRDWSKGIVPWTKKKQ